MATIHVRIDEKTKKQVKKILGDLGLDMSTAVNMYFQQILLNEGIPFDVTKSRYIPDHIMDQWEKEVKEAMQNKGYDNVDKMFADILSEKQDTE